MPHSLSSCPTFEEGSIIVGYVSCFGFTKLARWASRDFVFWVSGTLFICTKARERGELYINGLCCNLNPLEGGGLMKRSTLPFKGYRQIAVPCKHFYSKYKKQYGRGFYPPKVDVKVQEGREKLHTLVFLCFLKKNFPCIQPFRKLVIWPSHQILSLIFFI